MAPYVLLFLGSLALSLLFGLLWLRISKRLGVVEYCRPGTHKGKHEIPTAGGIIILAPMLALLALRYDGTYLALVSFSFVFFVSGLADDLVKIRKKSSTGLSKRMKLILHFLLAAAFCGIFYSTVSKSALYLIFNAAYLVFFINAVNITDGLDGMAAGNYVVALMSLILAFMLFGNAELLPFTVVLAGACIGFMGFNLHPARMFMGDAGASMLGGAIAMLAILGKLKFWLFIVGAVFVVEGASSAIQLLSKALLGRRVFPMAPIHHTLLMRGMGEERIVFLSWLMSCALMLAALGWLALA